MKTIPLLLLSLCAVARLPLAAGELAPIKLSHVGLTAQLGYAKAAALDQFKTDYGSSDIHTEKERRVEGAVRNFGKTPAAVGICITWVGKKIGTNTRTVLKFDWKLATIAPGATFAFTSESGVIKGRDQNLVMIGSRTVEGERIEGWIVAVHEDDPARKEPGDILALTSDATHLLDYYRASFTSPKKDSPRAK